MTGAQYEAAISRGWAAISKHMAARNFPAASQAMRLTALLIEGSTTGAKA